MSDSQTLHDLLHERTKGLPFVFVIMDFKENFHVYENVENVVSELGMVCLRADHLASSGADLESKIHLLIQRAEIVVCDLSTDSPNVYYEVGYTVATGKTPILLCEKNKPLPTDLRGREVIRHGGSKEEHERFKIDLKAHLKASADNNQSGLLRDMLISENPEPAFIVASPKSPEKSSRFASGVYDRRTFSDNIGILGLITSFGSVLGVSRQIELVSAGHLPANFCFAPSPPKNLYFIGSRKVNRPGGEMLNRIQLNKLPQWEFGTMDDEPEVDKEGNPLDFHVRLFKRDKFGKEKIQGRTEKTELSDGGEGLVHFVDHGIVVRAPHPDFPDRQVLIMAGAHSLGTAAACMAATRPALIREFRDELQKTWKATQSECENPLPFDFADKSLPFWVLVKGEASKNDNLLDENGVSIESVGFYSSDTA